MNKSLIKKIKNYSAAAGSVVAATSASGQIIYTDVNPDLTVSGNMHAYMLDLDNDANADFLFLMLQCIETWMKRYNIQLI